MGYSRKYKRTNKLKGMILMEDAKRQVAVEPIKITDELIIDYGKLRKFVDNMGVREDTGVTLMYLISALFPTAYKNFEKGMLDQYTKGYMQGREDVEYERTHPKRD